MAFSNVLFLLAFCLKIMIIIGEEEGSCREHQCKHVPLNSFLKEINVTALQDGGRKLVVLCYPGQSRNWFRIWLNPKIRLKTLEPVNDFEFYYGHDIKEVLARSREINLLSWSPVTWLKDEHDFDPFNKSCIGVSSARAYRVYFAEKNPEWRYLIYTASGLLLFYLASPLSRNTLLQYSTGVSVGVLGSLLLVMFLISRLLPQRLRSLSYVLAAVSTSAYLYMYQWVSYYLSDLVRDHWQILIGYIVVMGLISFGLVYRYGPISNQRTLNLVKWSIQLLGLVLVYQGGQIPEVSVAFILVAVAVYLFPPGLWAWTKRLKYRYFPPKTKLQSEEEFHNEGQVETKKALDELRVFCQSPKCDAWKTISRLSSPNKFASFVEGSFHLSETELEDHNTTYTYEVDDDSDSELAAYTSGTR